MERYILVRGEERIEVLPGREERRDRLIRAGYEWVNKPAPAKERVKDADLKRKAGPAEESGGNLPD
jgi:hypothetical protein